MGGRRRYSGAQGGEISAKPLSGAYWIIAALAIVVVLRAPMFLNTLEPDSMCFAYVGQVIADGGRPYLDAWDHKPPGVHVLNALVLKLAPWNKAMIILFESFWILVAALAAYSVAKRVLGRSSARWVPLLLLFSVNLNYLSASGNLTETYGLLPMALGYAAFFAAWDRDRKSPLLLAGSGAAFALAMQFRVTYCLPLVGLGITVLCVAEERSFSVTRLRSLAYVTIGFVGAWIAVVIVLAAWGILPAYFENVYFSGWKYVSASHSFPGHRILKSFVRGGPAMLIGFIGMARAFLTRSNAKTKTMALCSVCDLGGALLSTHWYGHYFIQPLIPFSILTVYFLKESLGPRSIIPQVPYANLTGLKGKFRFTAALFVFSLCCALFYQVTYVLDLSRQISNERSGLMSQKKAARYIRESTDPSDYLIAHGSGSISGLYFLSHRRAASKHFYTLHFGKKFGEFSPWQESVFREYLAEIRQNRPSFVVLYKEREIELPEPYGTEFLSWLNESYVHEKTIDPYEMWHRR